VCSTASDLPIGIAPAFVAKGDLRVIAVKSDDASPAVLPTDENLRARKYPIILPFTMYWDTRTQDEKLVKFVDFCASKGVGK
jgi:ABC-type phosphate transport system substrate-binding protein